MKYSALLLLILGGAVAALAPPAPPHQPAVKAETAASCDCCTSRRQALATALSGSSAGAAALIAAVSGGALSPQKAVAAVAGGGGDTAGASTVIKTSSGLKYIDLLQGTGVSPAFGQLVSIRYKAFIKLPNDPKIQQFDAVNDGYLYKHGNGRCIAGLDEGLHTMKVGGQRRILIPPKLGYVDVGLGPVPEMPWNRWKLNNLLDQMVKVSGGTVIYEVTLNKVVDDEVDQGYYQDDSLSPEDFDTLRENLRKKGNAEKIKQQAEAAAAAVQGQAASAANRIV